MSSLGGFTGGKGSSGNGNRGTVGRTLAGVFSGAAANIRSKFSNLGTVNNTLQPSSPIPEQTAINSATSSSTISPTLNHNHGVLRDSSQSPTTYMSNEETFRSHTPHYSPQQYISQFQHHEWSEATSGKLSNNKYVEHLAPNALPITVPGADVNDAVGGVSGGAMALSSASPITTSIQTLSFVGSQSPSYAFGMNC